MRTKAVAEVWEFYRDNYPGPKEPMRKQMRELDAYVAKLEAENEWLAKKLDDMDDTLSHAGKWGYV